jgi:long-subunit acyl-CoA synthetase (AMP-forming)
MGVGRRGFAFLPLAHVLTRMTQLVALRSGATIAYWRRDMTTVLEDLAEIRRPTCRRSRGCSRRRTHGRTLPPRRAGG